MDIRIQTIFGIALALGVHCLSEAAIVVSHAGNGRAPEARHMIDIQTTEARLREHLKILTVEIGERSVRLPANLKRTAEYIRGFYEGIGVEARLETYGYPGFEVANVVAEIRSGSNPAKRILIGAHYDSVAGTVGADDNASAVACSWRPPGRCWR